MIRIANLDSPDYFRWRFLEEPCDFPTWLREDQYVWDTDSCGDRTTYWAVVSHDTTLSYWKCKHSWWIEDSEDCYVRNEFEIEMVNREDIQDKYAKESLKFVVV